jgi:serine/threonine-protein kinase
MPEFHTPTPPSGVQKRQLIKGFVRKVHDILAPDHMIGKNVDGYMIEEKIAKGGMSTIYRAANAEGSPAAVKILDEQYCHHEKSVDGFLFEAQLIEDIDHPNIVKGLSHGTIDGVRLYNVMEYLEGADAGTEIKRAGKFAPEIALGILLEACRGLEELHSRGVIHRDVKPDNIVLSTGGRTRIIDLGIAKDMSKARTEEWNGTIYGTIYYVAPEQTNGNDYDHRADIYALGVSGYKMLCGLQPIESDDIRKLLDLIRIMTPSEPSRRCPELGIPREADEIIMKALSKRPQDRFQSALEMAKAIEKFLFAL